MLPGETLLTGAANPCPNCNTKVAPKAMFSNAGWYSGTQCNCGPYTRESEYLPTRKQADDLSVIIGLILSGNMKLDPVADLIRLPGFSQTSKLSIELLDPDDSEVMEKILEEHQ